MRSCGTSGYSAGCRCPVCTAANAASCRAYRATPAGQETAAKAVEAWRERAAASGFAGMHGTVSGYNAGCRCDDCRAAINAYHRARRAAAADRRRRYGLAGPARR